MFRSSTLSRFLPMAVLALCLGVSLGYGVRLHPTGLIYEDLSKTPGWTELKQVPVAPGARAYQPLSRVDLSGELPPVGDQGSQGSCTAWGVGYYHRSQLEWLERHWDLTQPAHQFSPAFIYNQINGGMDWGSGFNEASDLIMSQGCATMADCPYSDADYTSWPSESAYSRAIPFRVRTRNYIQTVDSSSLVQVKQLLNNGYTSALAIWVWGNFDDIGSYHNTYCASERTGSNRGGHVVCILGYDDTLTTTDGRGAFRMVNSWGTGWGQAGYWWMSYQAVLDTFLCQRWVMCLTDTVGYQPSLLGRVRLAHPARDRVGIRMAVGPRDGPFWVKDFRAWRWPNQDRAFPDHDIVFDLTEAADYLTQGYTDSIYVRAIDDSADGQTGSLVHFSAQYLPWGSIAVSPDSQIVIPDQGVPVYAGARIAGAGKDAGPAAIIAPAGVIDSGTTLTPRVKVKNFGTSAISFPVRFQIGAAYADSLNVSNLGPGDSSTLSFRTWTAVHRGAVTTRCTTALTGDQIPGNNALSDSATVWVRDLAVTAILSPADTVDSGIAVTPQVKVKNLGMQTVTFPAKFGIPVDGYIQTMTRMVAPGNEITIPFPNWMPLRTGTYAMRCTVALAGDLVPGNNLLVGSVTVRRAPAGIGSEMARQPLCFGLADIRPNPFRNGAVVRYSVPEPIPVQVRICNASGRVVRTLTDAVVPVGYHEATWDGRDARGDVVARGIYFCRMDAGSFAATRELRKVE